MPCKKELFYSHIASTYHLTLLNTMPCWRLEFIPKPHIRQGNGGALHGQAPHKVRQTVVPGLVNPDARAIVFLGSRCQDREGRKTEEGGGDKGRLAGG